MLVVRNPFSCGDLILLFESFQCCSGFGVFSVVNNMSFILPLHFLILESKSDVG